MVGNRREALLWDLQEGKIDEGVKPVPVKVGSKKLFCFYIFMKNVCLIIFQKVWMVCLMHPYIFLVGGNDWEGLQVKVDIYSIFIIYREKKTI